MSNTKIKIDLTDSKFDYRTVVPKFNYLYHTFSNPLNIRNTSLRYYEIGTLEHNQFVLDGSQYLMGNTDLDIFKFFPGVHSFAFSDNYIWNNLELELLFNENHTSNGIQLIFSKYDYCTKLNAKFYLNDVLIQNIDKESNTNDYFIGIDDEFTYNKVIITFKECNNNERTLKLYHVAFAPSLIFEHNNILSCNLIEQQDIICNELPINEVNFEIYDSDDSFNILNPQGVYNKLKTNQAIEVYHNETGVDNFMGKFYLSSWESESENIGKFKAVNIIGLLDNIQFTDQHETWNGETINSVYWEIDNLLYSVGMSNMYNIDTIFENIKLNTIIYTDSARNILQKLCFAANATVSDARNTLLNIGTNKTEIISNITSDRIFQDTFKITRKDYINQINVYGYNYNKSYTQPTTSRELATITKTSDGTEYEYVFDKPVLITNKLWDSKTQEYYILSTNNDKIRLTLTTLFKIKYIIPDYSVRQDITFKLEGHDVEDFKEVYTLNLNSNENNAITVDCNTIAVSDAIDIISNDKIANKLKDYYNNQYELELELELQNEKVGDCVTIECPYNQVFIGNITSLDIDITGGYTAKLKAIGGLHNES